MHNNINNENAATVDMTLDQDEFLNKIMSSNKADIWWQLFDSNSKKFYYYNGFKQKTQWTKPNKEQRSDKDEKDDDSLVFIDLASKILNLLVENKIVNSNFEKIIENIVKSNQTTIDLFILNQIFNETIKTERAENKELFEKRPNQPRTNPNYINVDLIDKQNGSLLRNTYIKLQQIEQQQQQQLENKNKFFIKKMSNSRSNLKKSNSLNGPELVKSDLALLLVALLNETTNKQASQQIINENENDSFKMKKIKSDLENKTNRNYNSLSSCFFANLTNSNQIESNSNTYNQKIQDKSVNFNSNHKQPSTPSSLNNRNRNIIEIEKLPIQNSSTDSTRSNKKSWHISNTNNNSTNNTNSKSKSNLDDSFTSIDFLHNEQNIQNSLNYSYSPSTTSLAADLNSLNNFNTQKHLHFNQRLKNLRRSFNNTNNKKQISSQVFSRSNAANEQESTSLSYMITNNTENNFTNNYNSPLLTRKPSETNLLFIKKNQIDLNVHHEKLKTGFLFFASKKKIPDQNVMIWTNQTIQKPLIKTNNKIIKKEACELFKLIQIYMGDRSSNLLLSHTRFNCASSSIALETQQDLICLDIMTKGWMHTQLRDELYLQIVKQTTCNSSKQSSLLGWQLMAVCLSFFPPTQKLYPFLNEYILSHTQQQQQQQVYFDTLSFRIQENNNNNNNQDNNFEHISQLARTCLRRLEKIQITGAKKGLKSPSIDEVILSKSTILNPSLFGATLDEIMLVQRRKYPQLQLPWIQTTLSEAVIRLNGAKTEGIFRVPGDLDEVNNLKVKFDRLWCSEQPLNQKSVLEILENVTDPHLPASLLKLWYRELYEPLIPNEFYEECIINCEQADKCLNVIQKLPKINRLVFTYLIKFLKVFADCDNVAVTKMDANNLSMVMAPNCLRCKSDEPKTIMENTKKEMQFLKTLIKHLDTSCVQDIF